MVKDGKYASAYTTFYGKVYNHWGTSRYRGSAQYMYRFVFGNGGNGDG